MRLSGKTNPSGGGYVAAGGRSRANYAQRLMGCYVMWELRLKNYVYMFESLLFVV